MVEIHHPVVVTDGGPWAEHDQACAVCRQRKAVLDLHTGIFEPCWDCQRIGWRLMIPTPMGRRWWERMRRRVASDTTNGDDAKT